MSSDAHRPERDGSASLASSRGPCPIITAQRPSATPNAARETGIDSDVLLSTISESDRDTAPALRPNTSPAWPISLKQATGQRSTIKGTTGRTSGRHSYCADKILEATRIRTVTDFPCGLS